ncbi:hypothetical protein ACFWPU_45640 [Streptomyces sp. NPDC058471]|uniref:hypothetical protein n=1 Tax=Streptomyces sp. NPDC058471 TaxID=3346516 RepID=UPI00364A4B75
MRKVSTRRALIPAAALVLTASFAATASAEESTDAPPEDVSTEQIATQETADSAGESPTMSAEEAAVEDKLDALPEASDDSSAPPRCDNPYKKWYKTTSKTNYHVPARWNGTTFKDGPGGTMKVKVEKSGKVGVELSGSIEASANAIIAKSKATFGVKVYGEVGVTIGHEYSHDIPSRKYGHLQYGSWGYNVKWTKYATSADRCSKVKLGSGTAKLPTKSTGWRFWTTSS